MLLSELVRKTPEAHEDYDSLCKSHRAAKELADYVNERKREAESRAAFAELRGKRFSAPSGFVLPSPAPAPLSWGGSIIRKPRDKHDYNSTLVLLRLQCTHVF